MISAYLMYNYFSVDGCAGVEYLEHWSVGMFGALQQYLTRQFGGAVTVMPAELYLEMYRKETEELSAYSEASHIELRRHSKLANLTHLRQMFHKAS